MSERQEASSAACPYCGEPKDRHTHATPTRCILGGFPPVTVESAAQGPPDYEEVPSDTLFGSRPKTRASSDGGGPFSDRWWPITVRITYWLSGFVVGASVALAVLHG